MNTAEQPDLMLMLYIKIASTFLFVTSIKLFRISLYKLYKI